MTILGVRVVNRDTLKVQIESLFVAKTQPEREHISAIFSDSYTIALSVCQTMNRVGSALRSRAGTYEALGRLERLVCYFNLVSI